MTVTRIDPIVADRRRQLIDLAVWAAGEHAKQELGLPSEWNQGAWLSGRGCNTTCCIAGKAALDHGAYPVLTLDEEEVLDPALARSLWRSDVDQLDGKDIEFDFDRVYAPGFDEPQDVAEYAQNVLHLTNREGGQLFEPDNDLDAVLRVIRDLLAVPDDHILAAL